MKNITRTIVAVLLIGGWALAASSLHVVATPGHLVVIPKDRVGIWSTYEDVRNWTLADVAAHPTVASRLIATGHADALAHVTKAANNDDLVAQLDDAIQNPAKYQPAPAPTTQPASASAHAHPAAPSTRPAVAKK